MCIYIGIDASVNVCLIFRSMFVCTYETTRYLAYGASN